MKFSMVNKLTTVNRFVLHTSHHNITHLAVITCKKNIEIKILKVGEKEEKNLYFIKALGLKPSSKKF